MRKRDDGAFVVSVSAGYDSESGKRRRISRVVRGSNRDAEQMLARLLLQTGKDGAATETLTLSGYLTGTWIPSLRLRQRTVDGYEANCRLHIIPHIGDIKLVDLTPYVLDRWVAHDLSELSGHTALHVFTVLRTALRQAVRWQLIDRDPTDAVSRPKAEDYQPRVLTIDEANAMLDSFTGTDLEPAVVLALGAGLRRSEICALDWSDIDFEAMTVSITKGLHQKKDKVWIEAPKSKTSRRVVTLPHWAIDALRKHRAVGPLLREDGARMAPWTLSYRFKSHRDAHGLADVPFKNLRHSHATLALQAGVDVVVVSRRLGHSTMTVTDQYYLRPHRSSDQAAAEKVDELFDR